MCHPEWAMGTAGQISHFFIAATAVLGWSVWESLRGEAGESVKIK